MSDWPTAGGGVRPTRDGNPSRFFPASGPAVVITAPVDATWSAYAVLSADSGAECVLSTINVECIHCVATPAVARSLFLELNVGAEGSEVPIGTWPDSSQVAVINQRYQRQFRLNGYKLAANSRLTARVRMSSLVSGSQVFTMTPTVVAPPSPVLFTRDWDEKACIQGGVSLEQLMPAAPSTTTAVCGAADTWGDPVEFIASAAGRLLVFGVDIRSASSGAPPQPTRVAVQVGIGAASSEVWHEATQLVSSATTGAIAGAVEFPRSVEAMPGERVALRAQGDVASKDVKMALILHDLNF